MRITEEMLEVMAGIAEAGRRHARAEIAAMGVELPERRDFVEPTDLNERTRRRLGPFLELLGRGLAAIGVRIRDETVGLELGGVAQDKLAEALERRVPGVLDLAGRLVSGSFARGLADVYEEAEDFFPCWRYSAVMDGATCPPCRRLDGTEYETLASLYVVLPGFGPNPSCRGGTRCRCRGVPCPPSEAPTSPAAGSREYEIRELVRDDLGRPLQSRYLDRALDALERTGLRIRSDDFIYSVSVRTEKNVVSRLGSVRLGGFEAKELGDGLVGNPLIHLNQFDHNPVATFVHEFGHYLDMLWLGRATPGNERAWFGSLKVVLGRGDDDSLPWGKELGDLMKAIVLSNNVQQLSRDKGDVTRLATSLGLDEKKVENALTYYLDATELFARAFTQWAASKSQNEDLLAEVARANGDDLSRPFATQWQWGDFVQIGAKFDLLFDAILRYTYR